MQWLAAAFKAFGIQILANLEASVHDTARQHYQAFFSSELGGIVVDPAMMGIHIDDHMVRPE